ncbi:hypothetical protein R9C05_00165 [Metamycoplasma subdolum]|nr:hypothetical protein [Metamycoplasma subdolum]WPB50566.1 hypothetical protein R9C05_00165 [Metamycoplasma subdolum]
MYKAVLTVNEVVTVSFESASLLMCITELGIITSPISATANNSSGRFNIPFGKVNFLIFAPLNCFEEWSGKITPSCKITSSIWAPTSFPDDVADENALLLISIPEGTTSFF